MLSWLSNQLIELKIDHLRDEVPSISHPAAWFRYFNYSSSGRLQRHELLRGVAKSCDVASLMGPDRSVEGIKKLKEELQNLWDDVRWGASGVPLDDFEGPGGLAECVLKMLPTSDAPQRCTSRLDGRNAYPISADEALAKALKEDLAQIEEIEAFAKNRAEARQRVMQQAETRVAPNQSQPRAGSEMLLTSLLEAATQIRSSGAANDTAVPSSEIRIRCPFCQAVNACSAAPGHRVICGGCRSCFEVPQ
jgi:hypothetical protein